MPLLAPSRQGATVKTGQNPESGDSRRERSPSGKTRPPRSGNFRRTTQSTTGQIWEVRVVRPQRRGHKRHQAGFTCEGGLQEHHDFGDSGFSRFGTRCNFSQDVARAPRECEEAQPAQRLGWSWPHTGPGSTKSSKTQANFGKVRTRWPWASAWHARGVRAACEWRRIVEMSRAERP